MSTTVPIDLSGDEPIPFALTAAASIAQQRTAVCPINPSFCTRGAGHPLGGCWGVQVTVPVPAGATDPNLAPVTAQIETDFDTGLPKMSIDIGRDVVWVAPAELRAYAAQVIAGAAGMIALAEQYEQLQRARR